MPKPKTFDGYDEGYTLDCERVLVTLLRGLGPWKESVYLIGGLTPRYLVDDSGEGVPPHAGTQDVDIVIDLQILADTEAYHTLEENLKKMDFERAENDEGKKLSWRWKTKTEADVTVILELISESEELGGGKVQALPTEKTISALNVPHASMVFDLHEIKEIQAELLGENGVATEEVRFANLVSFTCLKAFAFDQRNERKDAHDLIYCLEHAPGRVTAAKEQFRKELNGKHAETVRSALDILRKRFASDEKIEGYQKDGPVAVAKFELGESNEEATKESRILRQLALGTIPRVCVLTHTPSSRNRHDLKQRVHRRSSTAIRQECESATNRTCRFVPAQQKRYLQQTFSAPHAKYYRKCGSCHKKIHFKTV